MVIAGEIEVFAFFLCGARHKLMVQGEYAMIKQVQRKNIVIAAIVFAVFMIIYLASYLPRDYSRLTWQIFVIALIGSTPLVWKKYFFSAIFFTGFFCGGVFHYEILAIAVIIGIIVELINKYLMKKKTAHVIIILAVVIIAVTLLLWLPGVSLTLDGLLIEDALILHRESFSSCDLIIYRVDFMIGDGYIVDEITRPFGVFYRSEWLSGWFRDTPFMFYDRYDQPLAFVSLIKRVDNEIFIYIEPINEAIAYFIIGDFCEKVYALEEAKKAVDYYILIEVESDYIVLRDDQERWQPYPRFPGIIAFDRHGELVGGAIWDVPWYDPWDD
ncbi:MAG: hypothetical protein AB1767_12805 [Bacillota bacterium]